MARTVSLQQTVELVRETIAVAEEQVPLLAAAGDEGALREELLRFSREIAFAAARVYAGAAESRGAWDARLEALVIDGLVRGGGIGAPESQVAALGWRTTGPVTTVAGIAPDQEHAQDILAEVHRLAHRHGLRRHRRRARRPAGRGARRHRRPARRRPATSCRCSPTGRSWSAGRPATWPARRLLPGPR